MTDSPRAPGTLGGNAHRRPILIALMVTMALSAVDNTIVSTALDKMLEIQKARYTTSDKSMGEDAEPALPALIELLNADSVHDRKLAALTLGEIGPAAEEAVPALLEAADDENEGVSEMAIWALEKIDLTERLEEAGQRQPRHASPGEGGGDLSGDRDHQDCPGNLHPLPSTAGPGNRRACPG